MVYYIICSHLEGLVVTSPLILGISVRRLELTSSSSSPEATFTLIAFPDFPDISPSRGISTPRFLSKLSRCKVAIIAQALSRPVTEELSATTDTADAPGEDFDRDSTCSGVVALLVPSFW